MKICIVGDSGLLGQSLLNHFGQNPQNKILGISRHPFIPQYYMMPTRADFQHMEGDLVNGFDQIAVEISKFKPEWTINCAAIVDLKACELNPSYANTLHVTAVEMLHQLMHGQMRFVHISTDHIFDGIKREPYNENDIPHPLNTYGTTKWEGERYLHDKKDVLIIRTNIVGLRGNLKQPTFVEWLLKSWAAGQETVLFEDYFTSSMYVMDFVKYLEKVMLHKYSGILHVACRESVSKYTFGCMLNKRLGFPQNLISKGSLCNAKLIPQRPPFLGLDVGKFENLITEILPTAEETINHIANDYQTVYKGLFCEYTH